MRTIDVNEIRSLMNAMVAIETDITTVMNASGSEAVSSLAWKRLMDARINAMVAREKFTAFAVTPLLVQEAV